MARLRPLVSSYPELLCVVVAAIVGLTVQSPLAWSASHQGINVLLAVLVFASVRSRSSRPRCADSERYGGGW